MNRSWMADRRSYKPSRAVGIRNFMEINCAYLLMLVVIMQAY